jgi:hypothetical protein
MSSPCTSPPCAQVVIFVFCLLGMEFFGGALDPSARTKFDNLYWAFLAVFQVLTTENINSLVGGVSVPRPLLPLLPFLRPLALASAPCVVP